MKPYRLLAPGPVPVPPAVLKAMADKVLHHRTPAFEKILRECWAGLKKVFATEGSVQIITGTGSAAMEAAVVNLLSPGDRALVVVSGKFGERWAEICERYGVTTTRLNVPWGQAVDLAEFEEALKPGFHAVFTQACETSTATLHPIQKMSALVRKTSALFAVDAITAVGCVDLPFAEWQLDCVIGGSQKAFMIPTGLSFIALSERAWKAQAASKIPKFYLDLALEKKANAKGETHFSTPTPLLTGLGMVLQQMEKRGYGVVQKRCETLAAATKFAGLQLGLPLYSASPSPSVTALKTATDSQVLREELEKEENITLMGGQDQLKGKILRVGHMGHILDEDMMALFDALATKLGKSYDAKATAQLLASAPVLFE